MKTFFTAWKKTLGVRRLFPWCVVVPFGSFLLGVLFHLLIITTSADEAGERFFPLGYCLGLLSLSLYFYGKSILFGNRFQWVVGFGVTRREFLAVRAATDCLEALLGFLTVRGLYFLETLLVPAMIEAELPRFTQNAIAVPCALSCTLALTALISLFGALVARLGATGKSIVLFLPSYIFLFMQMLSRFAQQVPERFLFITETAAALPPPLQNLLGVCLLALLYFCYAKCGKKQTA